MDLPWQREECFVDVIGVTEIVDGLYLGTLAYAGSLQWEKH
jgi:hypothetical protein